MRKQCGAILLLSILLLSFGALAQEYTSIEQMHNNPPQRWTQSYQTKWRTILIDVEPSVPDALKLPIVKVSMNFWQPDVSALSEGWQSKITEKSAFFLTLNDLDKEEREAGGTTSTLVFNPPYDMGKVYAQKSNLSLGEALALLKSIMMKAGAPEDEWDYDKPTSIFTNTTVDKTTGQVLLPDSYSINLLQKIRGVPLLCHVNTGREDLGSDEPITYIDLTFQIRTPQSISIFGKRTNEMAVLCDDVPLCHFDKVKAALEAEIEAGHIRKIFDVSLGYALYNEPGVKREPGTEWLKSAIFYAVPVWQVNCHYIESAQEQMRDYKGMVTDERSMMEYKTLIINAQTGKMMNRSDNKRSSGDYQGFLSWEEVGGKQ